MSTPRTPSQLIPRDRIYAAYDELHANFTAACDRVVELESMQASAAVEAFADAIVKNATDTPRADRHVSSDDEDDDSDTATLMIKDLQRKLAAIDRELYVLTTRTIKKLAADNAERLATANARIKELENELRKASDLCPVADPLLARLEARIAELEAKDKRGDEIIAKYRELHVKQHQEIHKLKSAAPLVREKEGKE